MARSRRPELEKDNPAAPQVYRRKRRLALIRGGSAASREEHDPVADALQTLTDAAERFVNRVPRWKKSEPERQALLDAITRAQLTLSVEGMRAGRSSAAPND